MDNFHPGGFTLGHVALGLIAGSVPALGALVSILYTAHQAIDVSQGEAPASIIGDFIEYGVGAAIGYSMRNKTLSYRGV